MSFMRWPTQARSAALRDDRRPPGAQTWSGALHQSLGPAWQIFERQFPGGVDPPTTAWRLADPASGVCGAVCSSYTSITNNVTPKVRPRTCCLSLAHYELFPEAETCHCSLPFLRSQC